MCAGSGHSVRRIGALGGVLIVTAALALSACGGGNDSSAKANAAGSTIAPTGQPGSNSGGTTGDTTAGSTAHRPVTTKPQTTTTSPHSTTTTSAAAPTTTILNTIKPLPGRPAPPVFDYSGTYAVSASPITVNGIQYGVCRGPNHFTTVMVTWATVNTDYIQINGDHSNTVPAFGHEEFMQAKCDANHGPLANPRAVVQFVLFGPGGEKSTGLSVRVDRNYQP